MHKSAAVGETPATSDVRPQSFVEAREQVHVDITEASLNESERGERGVNRRLEEAVRILKVIHRSGLSAVVGGGEALAVVAELLRVRAKAAFLDFSVVAELAARNVLEDVVARQIRAPRGLNVTNFSSSK